MVGVIVDHRNARFFADKLKTPRGAGEFFERRSYSFRVNPHIEAYRKADKPVINVMPARYAHIEVPYRFAFLYDVKRKTETPRGQIYRAVQVAFGGTVSDFCGGNARHRLNAALIVAVIIANL